MKIFNQLGYEVLDIEVDDNSYRHRGIMGEHSLTLYYSLPEHVELPVGSYCVFQGETFTLERPEAFKMKHSRLFEYTVTMEAPEAKAKIWKFRNTVDGRLKFSLTAKPIEHLQMFVDNMNRRDKGWTVGDCIDGVEQCINYDHAFCLDALKQQASEFKTEYEFNGKRVSLKKVEYNKNNPLPLSYGRGNGFKSGVGRTNTGDKPPVEILYVQGGSDNLDPSKYGASELRLPKGKQLGYDGEHFDTEDGFNKAASRLYITDDDGLSIRRYDKQLSSLAEDSLDCSSICPKRVGVVSKVITVDEENNFYDFTDTTIPETLNFEDCLIEGEKMTVIFQTGMLAGREFEVKYHHEAKTVRGVKKEARRFELVPQEIDGQTMPNETYKPSAGGVKPDTYAVFNCMMPDAYICDNETKTGASWDMFREAVKYIFDNEDTKFTFTGELDGIWAKKDWLNIGGRIVLGGFILFTDPRFQPDGVLVRITGIKDYINKPYSPVIELSNTTVSGSVSSTLKELQSQEVLIEDNQRAALQFTKRRFRDAQETIAMLESSLLDNFTWSISPIAVQTMSMLVGDESLQFRFVSSRTNPVQVAHAITWDNKQKQLTADAGIIQHMTLGISSLSSSHDTSEYRFWDVSEYMSGRIEEGEKKFYLYAKVSETGQTGSFLLSETAIKMGQVSGFYHLLVGVLNSEYDGERSFVTLYGFSEVLPGRVTTDRVVSGDGKSYFDMVANAMKLGDVLDFNTAGDGKLKLTGTIIQRGSVEQPIVMYRGQWSASEVYYVNDVVFATNEATGATSSYICNRQTTAGIEVTDTAYWSVFAEGVKGADGSDGTNGADGKNGNTTYYIYTLSGTTPATPSFINPAAIAAPWSRTTQESTETEHIYMSQSVLSGSTGIFSTWSTPIRISGADGKAGKDGSDIEFIYKLTSGAEPSTPVSVNTDDYVPSGWTDNPSGVSEKNSHEWISVRHKNAGETKWGSYSTPALWSKWGEKGQDGDGVEYIFKRCEVETVLDAPNSVDTDGYVPSGWTNNPSGVSDDYPYEYVAIRRSTNGVWGKFSTPKLWARYDVWHTNILEQTEFESVSKLDKWSRSYYQGGLSDDNYKHIKNGGINGLNYYSDVNTKIYSESNYKDILSQILTGGGINKLQANTWYTLSFWARCSANIVVLSPNYTSGYTFGTQSLYLFAGSKYKLTVYGYIDSYAKQYGKTLRAYIYREDSSGSWSWNRYVEIQSTTPQFAYLELSNIPATGEYKLGFYQYPNSSQMGTIYVNNFKLDKLDNVYSTYLYPDLIDTSKIFIDGVETSANSDGRTHYGSSTAWTRHRVTFRTKSYLSAYNTNYILFRLQPTPVAGMQTQLDICMPKLEIGKVATDYVPNSSDMHNNYQEYRFAKNGSASTAPSLDNTANEPTGWTISQPVVAALEYLWMIVGNKRSDGTLIGTWSTPVRVTPKDGTDGKSPVLVYRGQYDSSKTYYGTSQRVDAVKYNNTYWVAAVDAGTIQGIAPSSTSPQWNTFGAQFDSVATNLLLTENANIGDWFMSGGKIVSTLSESDKIELDAAAKKISVISTKSGGNYSADTTKGSKIYIDAENGVIEARTATDSTKLSYMSPNGLFSNQAGTKISLDTSGADRRAAIVGLGYGTLDVGSLGLNAIAGVYGLASNSGTAPAYGGYFEELMACGFVGQTKILSGANNEYYYIKDTDTIIIGMSSVQQSVYLLPTNKIGKTLIIKNVGAGLIRLYTRNTTSLVYKIFPNATPQTSYYDISNGQYAIAHYCGIVTYNGSNVGMWAITRF